MEELKPCPFCGGEAETSAGIIIGGKNENVTVECAICNAKVFDIFEANAIEAWNTRTYEEHIKQLEQLVRDMYENLIWADGILVTRGFMTDSGILSERMEELGIKVE